MKHPKILTNIAGKFVLSKNNTNENAKQDPQKPMRPQLYIKKHSLLWRAESRRCGLPQVKTHKLVV